MLFGAANAVGVEIPNPIPNPNPYPIMQAQFSAREATFALGCILLVGVGYLLCTQHQVNMLDLANRKEQHRHAEVLLESRIVAEPGVSFTLKEDTSGKNELLLEKRGGDAGSSPPAGAGSSLPITCTGANVRAIIRKFAGPDELLDLKEAKELDADRAKPCRSPCEWPESSPDRCFHNARPRGATTLDVKSATAFLACRVNMLPSRECKVLVCAE